MKESDLQTILAILKLHFSDVYLQSRAKHESVVVPAPGHFIKYSLQTNFSSLLVEVNIPGPSRGCQMVPKGCQLTIP